MRLFVLSGAWKAMPPAGKSSPVIVNGKLILTGHNGDSFLTVAYDAAAAHRRGSHKTRRRRLLPIWSGELYARCGRFAVSAHPAGALLFP